jgi:hypothetical protein
MFTHGSYYGDKVDIWSVGCILLELILGHDKFCDIWLINYDPECLQDPQSFEKAITETFTELPDLIRAAHHNSTVSSSVSDEIIHLILQLLTLNPHLRPRVKDICAHIWFEGAMTDLIITSPPRASFNVHNIGSPTHHSGMSSKEGAASYSAFSNGNNSTANSRPYSPPPLSLSLSFSLDSSRNLHREGLIPGTAASNLNQEILWQAYNNLSDRERKAMEDYILVRNSQSNSNANSLDLQDADGNGNKEAADEILKLPPIEPPTPSISHAKKILRRGEELANRNYNSSSSNTRGGSPGTNSSPALSSSSFNGNSPSGYNSHLFSPSTSEKHSSVGSGKLMASPISPMVLSSIGMSTPSSKSSSLPVLSEIPLYYDGKGGDYDDDNKNTQRSTNGEGKDTGRSATSSHHRK